MANEAPVERAPRRVLYICVGNSCRSQFAEAFSRQMASDVIAPASAGLYPLGRIAEATQTVGREFGLAFDGQSSKGLTEADLEQADLIVNLSGIPGQSLFRTKRPMVDWDVDDPYGEDLAVYRRIAAEIEEKVRHLADEFRSQRRHSASA